MNVRDIVQSLLHRSVRQLTRVAAVLALSGLTIMAVSIIWPKPLAVILAMSVGHMIGAAAVLCYFAAIIIDATRSRAITTSLPPPPKSQDRSIPPA